MVRVRLHVKRNDDPPVISTHDGFELTRIPLVGETLTLEDGELFRVRRVVHAPLRQSRSGSGTLHEFDGEVWVSRLDEVELEAWHRSV